MTDRERLRFIRETAEKANQHAIELAISERRRTGKDGPALILCGQISVLRQYVEDLAKEMDGQAGDE